MCPKVVKKCHFGSFLDLRMSKNDLFWTPFWTLISGTTPCGSVCVIMYLYGRPIYWVWADMSGGSKRGQKRGPEMTPFWVILGSKNDPKKGHFWTPSWNIPGASPLILLKRGLRRGVQKWVILGHPPGVGPRDPAWSLVNH